MADTETQVNFEQVLDLAQKLPPADQARLVEQLAPTIVRALTGVQAKPRRSLRGILADLGPAPSAEDIDAARQEVWSNFPREDV